MQDALVLELLQRRFQMDARLGQVQITIETIEGRKSIVLRGVVSTYTLKQTAQALIIGKFDGYEIHNLTEVDGYNYFPDFTENT